MSDAKVQLGLFDAPPKTAAAKPAAKKSEAAAPKKKAPKPREEKIEKASDPPAPPPSPKNDRTCPACSAENARELLSCMSERLPDGGLDMFFLVTRFRCSVCDHRWEFKTRRTDVCDHGVMRKVPCAECGRTWEMIDQEARERGRT